MLHSVIGEDSKIIITVIHQEQHEDLIKLILRMPKLALPLIFPSATFSLQLPLFWGELNVLESSA